MLFYSAVIMLLFAVCSCQDQRKAKNYNNKTLADDEAINFVKKGIESSLTEANASSLAKAHSSNPRIISFANMMIADHTQLGKELKQIELDKMINDRDSISMEHQVMISGLATRSGPAFDKAYIEMMIAGHEKAIELFRTVGNNTSGSIQKLSAKTLPALQMHLDSAKAINASLK